MGCRSRGETRIWRPSLPVIMVEQMQLVEREVLRIAIEDNGLPEALKNLHFANANRPGDRSIT
jgi:hypothetical protein